MARGSSEEVALAKARFVEAYRGAPRGTSVSLFCEENPEYGTLSKIRSWLARDKDFKAKVASAATVLHRYGKARKPGKKEEAPDAAAPPEVVPTLPAAPAPAPVPSAEPLTEKQLSWLAAYQDNSFDTLAACKASGLTFVEFERLIQDQGRFQDEYKVLERMKLKQLEDRYVRMAVNGEDRQALVGLLKAHGSQYAKIATGNEAGAYNILTASLADAERRWSQVFPQDVIRDAATPEVH